jgi:metallophosphoesterase superfamily enzyme
VTDLTQSLDRVVRPKEMLGRLGELLERSGIDLDTVSRVKTVKAWQGFMKDKNDEPQVVDMYGMEFIPTFADGPKWELPHPGPLYKIPTAPAKPVKVTGWKTALIFPDIQIGYFRTATNDLEPIQDEKALAVALGIAKAENPDLIVLVGDNLDLAEFGKYRLSPAFMRTTQATIDRASLLCAELRAAAPNARIIWIAGNHEERLPNFLMDNALAAFGLRQGNVPESFPVMSVPFLCHFDRYQIEYLPGYPASSFWINERLVIIHGDKVASGGSTAHKYLNTMKASVIYGHIHRREWAERTREDHDGPKTIMAASPGCLARIDGAVPSTRGGVDLDGRPLTRYEDWQQGVGVVRYEEGDGRFVYEQVPIRDGWALHQGKEFAA